MERLMVSACLLGFDCKYSGGSNRLPEDKLRALRERYLLVPVCPETAGGLPIPREPSERLGEKVLSRSGRDVTAAFRRGGETALVLARRFGCKKALLKENSPSCGSGKIYDGSFSGSLVPGYGVAAELLRDAGVALVGERALEDCLLNGETVQNEKI